MSHTRFLVINLPRDSGRFNYLRAALDARSLSYERIDAVDGSRLAEFSGPEIAPVQPSLRFPHGLLAKDQGLTMSHRKAALHLLKHDWPHAIVLEDDADFSPDFKSVVEKIAAEPPADIVKLEGFGSRAYSIVYRALEDRKLATPLVPTMGAATYFLTRRGAECIVELTSTIWGPADHVLAKAMRIEKSVHVLPYPAFQRIEVAIDHPGRAEMDATRLGVAARATREVYRYASQVAYTTCLASSGKLSAGRIQRINLQDRKAS